MYTNKLRDIYRNKLSNITINIYAKTEVPKFETSRTVSIR